MNVDLFCFAAACYFFERDDTNHRNKSTEISSEKKRLVASFQDKNKNKIKSENK